MKLTILQTGAVPAALQSRFSPYTDMFVTMFEAADAGFSFETIAVAEGAPLPDPGGLEAVLITGSPASVYDDLPWIDPLRAFIRKAYADKTRMVGICFGHQIIADALGGTVRKADKGWGLGRHRYRNHGAAELGLEAREIAVACSHQDQVVVAPPDARIVLASDFTPNAGLVYANGAVLTVQPHPEFGDAYAHALIDLRADGASQPLIETARASMATPSDSPALTRAIVRFLKG